MMHMRNYLVTNEKIFYMDLNYGNARSQVTQERSIKNRSDFLYLYTTLIIAEKYNMQLITADILTINSA